MLVPPQAVHNNSSLGDILIKIYMKRFLRKEVVVDTPTDGSTKTKGGFTISNDRAEYLTGNVIQIGDEVEKVNIGDKIVFLAKALNTCSYEDKSFNFVIEDNIIGIDE